MSQPVREALAETVYPSIAALGVGRLCGRLLNLLPLRIGRIRLTHVIFGALLAPVAPVLYGVHKVIGRYYRLTQAAVESCPMIGTAGVDRIELERIAAVEVRTRRGQRFYRAGDVHLLGADGQTLLNLAGVPQPERVRQIILELQQAKQQRDAAQQTIRTRRRFETV